ncbi:prepilin-type N-terminal cleavage/methylation domain-containing protein [Limisalsivibrio acetivorans]|uniref:prepilin-type N-terminal cleavage/methylation domain-containing protein n=1 Tax=Limisalsivibrio acetivorans TaxID=1304888 RepID=UPI0003B6BC9C|nr:prepilin-type N-terminal cleavage/methylation domain-containing protein [Limisalsivibrio acetivorans]
MNRKGFTLVEMAIVLVIIGIILGMVMKGKELIQGAKVKNFVTDVRSLENMQFTFYERFNRFAGDCDNDGLVDETGQNNGIGTINNTPAGLCADTNTSNDPDQAFSELEAAGILPTQANDQHAQFSDGLGFAYYAEYGGLNVIVVRGVPCYAAQTLDSVIDKAIDGTDGRVREEDDQTWTAGGCADINADTVDLAYYFDRAP